MMWPIHIVEQRVAPRGLGVLEQGHFSGNKAKFFRETKAIFGSRGYKKTFVLAHLSQRLKSGISMALVWHFLSVYLSICCRH